MGPEVPCKKNNNNNYIITIFTIIIIINFFYFFRIKIISQEIASTYLAGSSSIHAGLLNFTKSQPVSALKSNLNVPLTNEETLANYCQDKSDQINE